MTQFKDKLRDGFKTIITVPVLRNLIVYMVLLNFMFAPITVFFPLYSETANQLAAYETVFFIGILLGSIVVGFLGKLRKIIPIVIGLLCILLSFAGLAVVTNLYLAMGCMLLLGMGSPIVNVTLSSLFMVKVPREALGRASSMLRVLTESAKPISLSLTASLLFMYDVREMFLIISVLGLVLVMAMILNPTIRNTD